MKLVGFAALAIAAPSIALAQPEARPATAGVDETKPVTRADINAKLDADYADLDSDKDGKVTAAEINARLVKSGEAELDEIKKKRDASFAKLDANGDGSITKAEFDEKAPLPKLKEPDAKPFLAQFDADKDGGITKDEFRGPTLANFEKLDANKDGTVTPDEVKNAAAAPTPRKKPGVRETPPIGR